MTENETKTHATTKKAFPQEEFDKMRNLLPFHCIDFTLQESHLPDRLAGEFRQVLEGWEFSPKCGMARAIDGPIGTAETVLSILSGQISCNVDCVHEDSRDDIEDFMNAWRAMADAALREVTCARKKLAEDGLIMLVAKQKGEPKKPTTGDTDTDEDSPQGDKDPSSSDSDEYTTVKVEVGMRVNACNPEEHEYVDGVVVEICEHGYFVRDDDGEVFATKFGKLMIHPQHRAEEAA